jgi:hypothetical protein
MTRYAVIQTKARNASDCTRTISRYIDNTAYKVVGYYRPDGENPSYLLDVIIAGCDVAGWTLDGYVIPRLASGLIFCVELLERPREVTPRRR